MKLKVKHIKLEAVELSDFLEEHGLELVLEHIDGRSGYKAYINGFDIDSGKLSGQSKYDTISNIAEYYSCAERKIKGKKINIPYLKWDGKMEDNND